MAIQMRNKINADFSMAAMTDIIFNLLLFFLISTTLFSTNAVKLNLPRSDVKSAEKPVVMVSITKDLDFFIDRNQIEFNRLESALRVKFEGVKPENRLIALYADRTIPIEEAVKVLTIAAHNNYKLSLVTTER
ncbi:MAG: biopolymer transporter ExbD [Bacteroidota bacterium]